MSFLKKKKPIKNELCKVSSVIFEGSPGINNYLPMRHLNDKKNKVCAVNKRPI